MTGYYVLAGVSVAWALLLSAVGLTQRSFPPSGSMARALMGFALVLALVTVVVLVSTTEVEHPREEAAEAAEAAERASGGEQAPAGEQPAPAGEAAGGEAKSVPVKEDEFSIQVEGGNSLAAGAYDFKVANEGQIQHDLAVEGGGPEKKTPLIEGGGEAALQVALKPGKYRFYCTVPGHAQSGMEADVTVR